MEIKYLRPNFLEIANLLNGSDLDYWLAGGLAEQIAEGLIDDDESHDFDFHILETDRKKLKGLLFDNGYKIRENCSYKIQILTKQKCNNERGMRVEFVFLKECGNDYSYQSRNIIYSHPQKLFGDDRHEVKDVKIRIPSPIEEYLEKRKKIRMSIKSFLC